MPQFLNNLLDKLFQKRYGLPFPPTHFYSPIPDLDLVKKNQARWCEPDISPGIDFNAPGQVKVLKSLTPFAHELEKLETFTAITKKGYGPGYGEIEAHILHLMLRSIKPARVIEVGSGVSTLYTQTALKMNNELNGIHSKILCIEPYPNNKFKQLADKTNISLIEKEVQDVPLKTFEELEAGDVLFIDSSHVSKLDSDVDYLYLKVLPRLKKGVFIHIHDITFPMPTIPFSHPLFDKHIFFNEVSVAKAFLMFNSAFKIEMCQSYLHSIHPEEIKKLDPSYDNSYHFPSSLWLQKIL